MAFWELRALALGQMALERQKRTKPPHRAGWLHMCAFPSGLGIRPLKRAGGQQDKRPGRETTGGFLDPTRQPGYVRASWEVSLTWTIPLQSLGTGETYLHVYK